MKSLATIQKTFRVFMILSKAAMILSFVWAGLTGLGVLCGIVWYSGGTVAGASREMIQTLTGTGGLNQMIGVLLSDVTFALVEGTLFCLAFRYFRQEQADGMPFTGSGAERIKRLGIQTIVLPLVACIVSGVFCGVFDVPQVAVQDMSSLSGISMGIVLILASMIFRYGAQLEGRKDA